MKFFESISLINRFNKGDSAAITTIYDLYKPFIRSFVRHVIQNDRDVDDIVSNVFLKLITDRPRFDNKKHIRSWLYRTAKNECIDYLKQARIRKEKESEIEEHWYSDEEMMDLVSEAEARAEIRDKIRLAIDRLPRRCRTIYILFYYHELTNKQIAAQLRISEKTVANQKARAVKLLNLKNGSIHLVIAATGLIQWTYHFVKAK